MIKPLSPSILAVVLCWLSLAGGCSSRLDNQQSGIEGTGDTLASRGVVTRLGSVYVNGIHFETTEAAIYANGELTTEESIEPGMVVSIEARPGATSTHAVAEKVTVSYLVSGTIREVGVDPSGVLNLNVPGYTVIVPEETHFTGTDYDNLRAGDAVSISGLELDNETIYASHITMTPSTDMTYVNGRVQSLNPNTQTFFINDLTVDYSSNVNIENAAEQLTDGAHVSVSGYATGSSTLVANSISVNDARDYARWSTITEEGFINNYHSVHAFHVNGVAVDASQASLSGGTVEDLGDRIRASVRGRYLNGVLIAQSLHMILPSEIRTVGRVDEIDLVTQTIIVEDIAFQINSFTRFEDNHYMSNRYFDLDDLRVGDPVEVYARKIQNRWTAATLKRTTSNEFPFSIKGTITGYDNEDNFYLRDLLVILDNLPGYSRPSYDIGQAVFVTGTMIENKVLLADGVFPTISGCSHWVFDKCRPPPPTFFPTHEDDKEWDWKPWH